MIPPMFDINASIVIDRNHTRLVLEEEPRIEPHILHMFHPSLHMVYYLYKDIDT